MFDLRCTVEADAKYKELNATAEAREKKRDEQNVKKSPKAEGLVKQVAKTVKFSKENARHPSLNPHEHSTIPNPFDKNAKVFEAYAQNKTPVPIGCFGATAQTKAKSPSSRSLHIRNAESLKLLKRLKKGATEEVKPHNQGA